MLHCQFLLVSHRIGTKEALVLVYQTADGETVPTKVWAVGRADSRGIKFEVVSSSIPGTNPIGHRWARPIAAMPTEAPQRTVVQVDIPATDEVK